MNVEWGIYTLEEKLGQGGMAVVYKASKVRDDFKREVCLKQILPGLSDDPQFVEMFRKEAAVAASLRHPNIVAVTDVNRFEGQLFLEMELVDGIDLRRLLREVRELGLDLPLGFVHHVADGLLAAFRAWYASSWRTDGYWRSACGNYLDHLDLMKRPAGQAILPPGHFDALCVVPGVGSYGCATAPEVLLEPHAPVP